MAYYEPVCAGCGQGLSKVKELETINGKPYCPRCRVKKFGVEQMTSKPVGNVIKRMFGK